jgi:hypothetical protein
VTVTNVTPGVIVISHNLHQAGVAVRGPLSHVGHGRTLTLSNAPPGTYVFEFADVPHHLAPPAQTNQLAAGETLRVTGRWTFADVNANGLADSWEEQYFGAAAPGRPGTLDSDGDGFSDRAEFLAGTNPTNAAARLALRPPLPVASAQLLLGWDAAPGRGYRVQGSADGTAWSALTGWLRAAGTALTATVSRPTNGAPHLFRLEVEP